jgi:hypothetical protein
MLLGKTDFSTDVTCLSQSDLIAQRVRGFDDAADVADVYVAG